jgi:putative heme degradation protein
LKEQLIRELVKTGKDAEQMNKHYAGKVAALEKVGQINILCRVCTSCVHQVLRVTVL